MSETRDITELEAPEFANITWVPAGTVRFGVERRQLPAPAAKRFGLTEPMYGVCIHVFDSIDDRECLRFDCFPVGSHYHYLHQDAGTHEFMQHDADANGPALDWALRAIRNRLDPMLRRAGSPECADKMTGVHLLAVVENVAAVALEKLAYAPDE